jgi:hypothetical protein
MHPLDPDNTKNQVILILKYYLYKCRCLGDKPSINGGLKYLLSLSYVLWIVHSLIAPSVFSNVYLHWFFCVICLFLKKSRGRYKYKNI